MVAAAKGKALKADSALLPPIAGLPPELKALGQARSLGMPLFTGGLFDMSYKTIARIEGLENIYNGVKAWRSGNRDPGIQKLIVNLTKLGVM